MGSILGGNIKMGFLDRFLRGKKPKEVLEIKNQKKVSNLEELIKFVANRDNSDIARIKVLLEEKLIELKNDSTGRLLNLDGKFSGYQLCETTKEIFVGIDAIIKASDDVILNFNIVATPHYGIAHECYDFMLTQGFEEKDLACITPFMNDSAELEMLEKVKNGECTILITDAYRLNSKWQLSNLRILSENLTKSKTKHSEEGSLINLFLVDPESMTSSQIEQALEAIDAREGSPTNSIFQKNVMALMSVENASKSKALREMKKPEDLWTIDLVVKGLPKAIYENDCENLARWIDLIAHQSVPSATWELIDDATSLIRKLTEKNKFVKEDVTKSNFETYPGSGLCDVCSSVVQPGDAYLVPNDVFYSSKEYYYTYKKVHKTLGIDVSEQDFSLMKLMDKTTHSAVCSKCIHMFQKPEEEKYIEKGIALTAKGKFKEATNEFDNAIKINPQDANVWYMKASVLEKQGKFKEAIKAYDEAIKINPQDANVWYMKAQNLFLRGKSDEAIKAYDKVVEIDPQSAKAWYKKGVILGGRGKNDEAIKAYDKVVEIDPQSAEAWYNKSWCLRALGKNTDADAAYAKAKELGYTG